MNLRKGCVLYCIFISVYLSQAYRVLHFNLDELENFSTNDRPFEDNRIIDQIFNERQNHDKEQASRKCTVIQLDKTDKLFCLEYLTNNQKISRAWKTPLEYLDDVFGNANKDSEENRKSKKHSKKFIDLTRGDIKYDRSNTLRDFADDYVDFTGISRSNDRTGNGRSRKSFDMNFVANKILRNGPETESDESGSGSDESNTKTVRKSKKYDYESDASENSNNDSDSVEYVPIKPRKKVRKDPYRYMQAPTRNYEIVLDARRRLPYFLPKRMHWDEDDFKNLRNYWIHGPQGKYPGSYRMP